MVNFNRSLAIRLNRNLGVRSSLYFSRLDPKGDIFMNVITLAKQLPRKAAPLARKAKEHLPEIMLVGGVISNGAAVIFACKATLKVDDILKEREAKLAEVKEAGTELLEDDGVDYNDEDLKKDVAIVNTQHWSKLAKAYLPSGALWVLSLVLVAGSHIAMQNKIAMWMAAYSSLDQAFSSYRERVANELGEDKERELFLGAPETDEEGELWYPEMPRRYFRFFDAENSPRLWTKSKAANRDQVKICLSNLNKRMDRDDNQRLWLTDVFDEFDLKYDADLPYPLARCMAVYKDELKDGMLTLGVFEPWNAEAWKGESDNAKECALILDMSMFHFCAYDED